MESSFTMEVKTLFQPPSQDARLILLNDSTIHGAETDLREHLTECLYYVKTHRVYLVSGLFVFENTLCLCLFAPDGTVLLRQPALHLAPPMDGILQCGERVEVAHTELGNLFLCVDRDLCHPQVIRAAALKGADIVLSNQRLDPAENTESRLCCTAWNAAQSNNIYVVSLASGNAAVTCPALVTRGGDGYIVRRTSTFPVRFGLNTARLDEVRRQFQLMECINTNLVRDYAAELGR